MELEVWLPLVPIQIFLAVAGTAGLSPDYVGNFRGDLSVEGGQAVYRVPIELPKGPNNIQPNLHLVYNSGSANGLLGLGWGLDLLSVITRCPQTIAQDGRIRGVQYDDGDRFCLDGQRLVVVQGTYGADSSEYRTEVDTYSKIEALRQHGSGPEYFRVWRKDGMILEYGTSSQERGDSGTFSHPGPRTENVRPKHQWNLAILKDRADNEVHVKYVADSNFPNIIGYGTTIINFIYEDRPDKSTAYFKDGIVQDITHRLHGLEIRNPDLLKTYNMQYKESEVTTQSILYAMKMCDSDGVCLRPLQFNYESSDDLVKSFPEPKLGNSEFGTGWSEKPRFIRDMNGDGFNDIVGFDDSCVKVALNDGSGNNFAPTRCWVNAFGSSAGWRGTTHPRDLADVNGDNLPDVVGFFEDGVYVSFNTGKSLESPFNALSTCFTPNTGGWDAKAHVRLVADANGDGRADLVGFNDNGIFVALSEGETFDEARQWSDEFGQWTLEDHSRLLKDVSGDGLPDVIGFGDEGVHVAINTGSSFSKSSVWLMDHFHYTGGWTVPNHPRLVEDVNEDGLADIVGFYDDGVYISFSTGTSFTEPTRQLGAFGKDGGYPGPEHPRMVGDVTGDNLPDIIGINDDGITVSYNIGRGTFADPSEWLTDFSDSAAEWMNELLVDINGDGLLDIVGFTYDGLQVSINQNTRPKVHQFIDSFSVKQSLAYTSLPNALQDGRYERDTDLVYPVTGPCPPFQVVTGIDHFKDTAAENSTTYSYGGLRYNMAGRGPLGFRWMTETYHTGLSIFTEKAQNFPLTGRVTRVTQSVLNNNRKVTIAEKVLSYESCAKGRVFSVALNGKRIVNHDLDGSVVSEVVKTYSGANGYGDPLEMETRTIGGGQKISLNSGNCFDVRDCMNVKHNRGSWNTDISARVFTQRTVNSYYRAIVDKWLVGQLKSSRVTHESSGTEPITRYTEYQYNPYNGFLVQEIKEPDHQLSMTTNFKYDTFGNVVWKLEKPTYDWGLYREYTTTFESGLYVKTSTNGKGHEQEYEFDKVTGNLRSFTGANGLKTTWEYDRFGRKIEERHSDGRSTIWTYNWDKSLRGSVYNTKMESEGSVSKISIFDGLDRIIQEITTGARKYEIFVDTTYNKEGLVEKKTHPYFVDDHRVYIEYQYDLRGRTVSETQSGPDGTKVEKDIRYKGLNTISTDANSHQTESKKDALGRVTQVIDHAKGDIRYKYDSVGNLVQTTDPRGHVTKTEYNVLGHKVSVDDPNMGRWNYRHNAFGELVWQRDANKNELLLEYDKLGRVVKRTEPEGVTTWEYDSGPHGVGKLASVEQSGYERTWSYDVHGRESRIVTKINGQSLTVSLIYDKYGRITKQTFPNTVSIYKRYSKYGYLTEISLEKFGKSGRKLLWSASAHDAIGHVLKEQFGNKLITEYTYSSAKNLVGVDTYKDGEKKLRKLKYTYDSTENLLSRADLRQETSETFSYDSLDRLVQSTVSSDDETYQWRQNWDYFSDGSLRFNDKHGPNPFRYHSAKPQAVVAAGPHEYRYDNNGNAIEKDGKTIKWTSYNKPSVFQVTEDTDIEYTYGPDRHRHEKISTKGEITLYLGNLYEVLHVENENTPMSKVYIYGPMGRLLAIVSQSSQQDIAYVHTDNMGSVDTITGKNGNIIEQLSYDAFGSRRTGDWRVVDTKSQTSSRGFTGHEHIEELGLVHMNGRVYDPVIGRFLSPDPHVQDPLSTQAFNRYSYGLNNPLKYRDPSGYFSIGKFFSNPLKAIATIAVTVATAGIINPLVTYAVGAIGLTGTVAAVTKGVVIGAAGGFSGGTFATGNIKGGMQGAVGGAVFGGVGGYFGHTWSAERVLAQATAGGVVSDAAGGNFKDGFLMSGLAASARYLYNNVVEYDVDIRPGGEAVTKTDYGMPNPFRNNFGTQGKEPNPCWFDDEQLIGVNWGEGGGLSRFMNHVPGVNAIAGLHDVFQVRLDDVFFPGARDIFNVPGMLPAAGISYIALHDGPGMAAVLVDEARKTGENKR